MMLEHITEKLIFNRSHGFFVSGEMLPVRRDQAIDDLLMIEKEFASEIYIQRCKERDL